MLSAIARAFIAPLFTSDEPAPVNGTMDGVGEGVRTWITILGTGAEFSGERAHLINHMHNPIIRNQIGRHNLRVIDEVVFAVGGDCYGEAGACLRGERAPVRQEREVPGELGNDVAG